MKIVATAAPTTRSTRQNVLVPRNPRLRRGQPGTQHKLRRRRIRHLWRLRHLGNARALKTGAATTGGAASLDSLTPESLTRGEISTEGATAVGAPALATTDCTAAANARASGLAAAAVVIHRNRRNRHARAPPSARSTALATSSPHTPRTSTRPADTGKPHASHFRRPLNTGGTWLWSASSAFPASAAGAQCRRPEQRLSGRNRGSGLGYRSSLRHVRLLRGSLPRVGRRACDFSIHRRQHRGLPGPHSLRDCNRLCQFSRNLVCRHGGFLSTSFRPSLAITGAGVSSTESSRTGSSDAGSSKTASSRTCPARS